MNMSSISCQILKLGSISCQILKDHGENYMKVRPPLVRHLLRNCLLKLFISIISMNDSNSFTAMCCFSMSESEFMSMLSDRIMNKHHSVNLVPGPRTLFFMQQHFRADNVARDSLNPT